MKVRSISSRSIFIFAAGLLLVASGLVCGQGYGDRNRPNSNGGGALISGKVWMPDGSPAVGVKVVLASTDINTSTFTDADGMYSFGGLKGGTYAVSVKIEGYEQETASYTIDADSGPGRPIALPLYLRNPGQKKGDFISGNPMFRDVSKDAIAKFEKGMEKFSKNDANGALSAMDEAIATFPNFAVAYYEKGQIYLKLNDADKALEAFVKAITIKQDYLDAKYGYGLAQLQKKNYEVAAAAFNDVVQTKKDMAVAHLNLGISLFYLKNTRAAEAELKTAITSKGGESLGLAHLFLGQIYQQNKKNAEAATELQKYLDMVPKAPNADRIKSAIADLKKQS